MRFKKKHWFTITVVILIIYSLGVNITGALTTNSVPPKSESENLREPIPYTYEYNLELLNEGFSSSLAYSLFFSEKIPASTFASILFLIGSITAMVLYAAVINTKIVEKKI